MVDTLWFTAVTPSSFWLHPTLPLLPFINLWQIHIYMLFFVISNYNEKVFCMISVALRKPLTGFFFSFLTAGHVVPQLESQFKNVWEPVCIYVCVLISQSVYTTHKGEGRHGEVPRQTPLALFLPMDLLTALRRKSRLTRQALPQSKGSAMFLNICKCVKYVKTLSTSLTFTVNAVDHYFIMAKQILITKNDCKIFMVVTMTLMVPTSTTKWQNHFIGNLELGVPKWFFM